MEGWREGGREGEGGEEAGEGGVRAPSGTELCKQSLYTVSVLHVWSGVTVCTRPALGNHSGRFNSTH